MTYFVHEAGGVRPRAEASATLVAPGSVPDVEIPRSTVTFVAPGSLTGGRYGLFRFDTAPGTGGARPHLHTGFSESFYVLSGTLTLFDGHSWVPSGPGSFVHVPEHGVHGFRNDTRELVSFLVLFSPGTPREEFFGELAEMAASGRRLSEQEMLAFYQRHDQYMVDDPTS
jgi:mannose-6-phosphate isomerase-like protein (cupin superfamily)